MSETQHRIVLMGPPGSGKGTQAARLTKRLGVSHLSSGDIFRQEVADKTELGRLAKSFMDRGELVPDEVTIGMMRGKIDTPDVRDRGFLLDGFPRTVAQARALGEMLHTVNMDLDAVISLNVPDEVVVRRLGERLVCGSCGATYNSRTQPPKAEGRCDQCGSVVSVREDDKPATVRERLRVFHENTKPVEDYYAGERLLIEIDASGSPDAVFELVMGALCH